jgi:hypothetical protein
MARKVFVLAHSYAIARRYGREVLRLPPGEIGYLDEDYRLRGQQDFEVHVIGRGWMWDSRKRRAYEYACSRPECVIVRAEL